MPFFPKPQPVDPFELFMAKLIGVKFERREANTVLVGYLYKGCIYVTELYSVT